MTVPINVSMDIGPAQWTSAVRPSCIMLKDGMQDESTASNTSWDCIMKTVASQSSITSQP